MAIRVNLTIDQGADWDADIFVANENDNAIDISTYTANSQIRKHYTSTIAYDFGTATNANGAVTLSMNASSTALIPAGRYVYDCELTSNTGITSRIVQGIVTIVPQVTR